jgi:hypothetical protein
MALCAGGLTLGEIARIPWMRLSLAPYIAHFTSPARSLMPARGALRWSGGRGRWHTGGGLLDGPSRVPLLECRAKPIIWAVLGVAWPGMEARLAALRH